MKVLATLAVAVVLVPVAVVLLLLSPPPEAALASVCLSPDGASDTGLTDEQRTNAATIIAVGKAAGVPSRGLAVAIAIAKQESDLRNLPGGDRDSIGLFQQRPSQGWGTPAQLRDPSYATAAFYGGPDPPGNPGLLDVAGWEAMPLTVAAQTVQRSAFPDAYARWTTLALETVAGAGGDTDTVDCSTAEGGEVPTGSPPPPPRSADGSWPSQGCTIRPDPSVGRGCLTPRGATILALSRSLSPEATVIACWDPHLQNPRSMHPRGRACDVHPGPPAVRAAGAALTRGDEAVAALIANADRFAIQTVIWQGRYWTASSKRWRPYGGGGVYNPRDVVGGHYDHYHVDVF